MKQRRSWVTKCVSLALAAMLTASAPAGGMSASAAAMQGDYFVDGGFAYLITGLRADNGANTVKLYQDENMQSYASYTGDYVLPEALLVDGVEYTVDEIGGAIGDTVPGALENVNLRGVTLPGTLTTIGSRAFANSSVYSIDSFPTSISKLADDAFTGTNVQVLNLRVNNEAALISSQAYSVTGENGKTSVVVLPAMIQDVSVENSLSVKGDTVVFGNVENKTETITVCSGGKLTVGGTLLMSGTGRICIEDNAVLEVSSTIMADQKIYLQGKNAKLVNNSSTAIRVWNAAGQAINVLPGENTVGGDAPAEESANYPQIDKNEGGSVTVLDEGKTIEITPDEGYKIESVTINGFDMGIISRYEFTEASSENTVVVVFAKGETEEGPELPTFFTDVATTAPYADAVMFLVDQGICSGVGNGKFAPNQKVDRGTMLSLLYQAQNYNEDFVVKTENTEVPYYDVAEGDWYYNAIGWAVNVGITNRAEKLNPSAIITREEFAVSLYRYTHARGYAAYQEAGRYHAYKDATLLNYESRCALTWAATVGYLTADNDVLNPAGTMTRAELAQAVALYLQKN